MPQQSQQSQQSFTVPLNQYIPQPARKLIFSKSGMLLIVMLGILVALNLRGGKKKGKLARARFGGGREKKAARKLACKQMENPKHEEIALYIGKPKGSKIEKDIDGKKVLYLPKNPRTVYLPNAQENILYIGRSGSGKTFSAGDPLVRSAVDQGFPIFYYDFKGHEDPAPSSKIAGYAAQHGYKISMLAPGYAETGVFNPVSLLDNPNDAEMAYQIASVLSENFKLSDSSTSNSDFFTQTGNQLVQAIFMLAKSSPYPDIAMCHKILALPNLIRRLQAAHLSPYLKVAFDNFLSSAGSPETAASIATTASLMFTKFMTPKLLAAFGGKTTLPLDVEGRHLVIFKMNPSQRSVVAPLLASAIHLMVNRNIFRKRKTPLILSLDEVNTIKLPMLVHWLNQNRSSKFCSLLGVQSIPFLEEVYGEKSVNGMLGGCTTQIVFELNDQQTAEYYSKQLGNEDIPYKQKSRSHGKGGGNRSSSEQLQTRPLVEIQQLGQMRRGKCIILNSGYGDSQEVRIPIRQQIKIPPWDIKARQKGVSLWSEIQANLIKESAAKDLPEEGLEVRESVARIFLPDPKEQKQTQEYNSSY